MTSTINAAYFQDRTLGNACFNPVSLLVGCSTDEMIDDPNLNILFVEMMSELLELGSRLGVSPKIDPHQRIAITRKLGKVKTSMLQDVEAHKPVEIEAILGAMMSVADLVGAPMTRTRTVYGLARMRARTLGLLPEGEPAEFGKNRTLRCNRSTASLRRRCEYRSPLQRRDQRAGKIPLP